MIQIVKNCRDDDVLRRSFNELAKRTFDLDFEDWYRNGFWRESYIPYSAVMGENVVANVSVNLMTILWNGVPKKFIQLGTVMTDETFQNQGLIRRLMEVIDEDYSRTVDGMYLFANDTVLDFYPKFGYRKAREYQCAKSVGADISAGQGTMVRVPMEDPQSWAELERAISASTFHGGFDMVENNGLYLFYVTKFMRNNVYFDPASETFAIAEVEEGKLLLHAVFARQEMEIDRVVKAFGNNKETNGRIEKVILGFTPRDFSGYSVEELHGEDTTLFVKGEIFADFEEQKLMFPTLSHA